MFSSAPDLNTVPGTKLVMGGPVKKEKQLPHCRPDCFVFPEAIFARQYNILGRFGVGAVIPLTVIPL